MIHIGIDPGNSGAIVIRNAELHIIRLNETLRDISRFIDQHCLGEAFALCEKVGAMPAQGIASTFKFGVSVGHCEALLAAHGVPWEYVTPSKWQREFGLLRQDRTETNTAKKNRHKRRAQELFPGIKITHREADALLISEYAVRTWTGKAGQS